MKRFDVYALAFMALLGIVLSSAIVAAGLSSTKPDLPARADYVQDFHLIRETEKGWLLLKTSSGMVCFVPASRTGEAWCNKAQLF